METGGALKWQRARDSYFRFVIANSRSGAFPLSENHERVDNILPVFGNKTETRIFPLALDVSKRSACRTKPRRAGH